MKKHIPALLIILAPFFLTAQNYSNKEKVIITARIDTLLQNYMLKSSLTEAGGTKRSDKITAEFRNLFEKDAMIFDDINPIFDEKEKGYPYKLKEKSRTDYFDGLIDEFPKGFIVNNKNVNISFDDFDQGFVSVALSRNIGGTSFTKKYDVFTDDTLLIKIKILPDKTVKIQNVSAIGSPLVQVINDKDKDGVIDAMDDCPLEKGPSSLKGCPDKDNDGVPDKDDECPGIAGDPENKGCPHTFFVNKYVFSASVGVTLNKNALTMPELSDLGYESLTKDSSHNAHIDNQGYKTGFDLNANIAYYFGKGNKRNKGISLGVMAINYRSSYKVTDGKYFYVASDENGSDKYHRIVSLNSAQEDYSFYILNIPLLLRYRGKFNGKFGGEIFAGPSYLSFLKNDLTNFTTHFDYEGIYQLNGTFNENYTYKKSDLLLTKYAINSKKNNGDANDPNADILYQMMTDYNFASDATVAQKEEVKKRHGLAINVGAELFYNVSPKSAVKIGGTFIYAPLKGNDEKYKMLKGANDTSYNSVLNINKTSNYLSIGINIGFILGI